MIFEAFIVFGIFRSTSAFHPLAVTFCPLRCRSVTSTRPFSLTTVRGLCLPPAPPTTPHHHHHHHLCESDYFIYISSFTVLFHLNLLLTTFSEKLNRRKVTVVCLRYTCSCTCALAPRESERGESDAVGSALQKVKC